MLPGMMGYLFGGVATVPDTEIIFPATGDDIRFAASASIHVWRNVDQSTPIDVAVVTASGSNSGRVNAGAITPVTTGAEIIVCGASSGLPTPTQTGSELSHFFASAQDDTYDASSGIGSKSWTGGSFNPVQWGPNGGSLSAWAAATLALRPAAGQTLSFVGGKSTAWPGTLSTTTVSLLSGLTGGSGGPPLTGDIVVVSFCIGSGSDVLMTITTPGYTKIADVNGPDTQDANLGVFWKIMG